MAKDTEPQVTPDIRTQLMEIESRDSATRTDQPLIDVNGAAVTVTPAAAVAPATLPAPVAEPADWWNGDDVSHSMLRAAKGADVERMFKSAQQKIREQGEQINRMRAAPTAASAPVVAPAPVAPATADPRLAEYELVQYTDPKRAREIVREWARDDARATVSESREHEAGQQRIASAVSAAHAGMATIANDYGIGAATLQRRVRTAVLPELNAFAQQVFADYGGESGDPAQIANAEEARRQVMQDPENYRRVYEGLYGAPAKATIAVPGVPARATPPHSMGPAPTAAPKVVRQPTIDPSLDRELSLLAGETLDETQMTEFKRRVASR